MTHWTSHMPSGLRRLNPSGRDHDKPEPRFPKLTRSWVPRRRGARFAACSLVHWHKT